MATQRNRGNYYDVNRTYTQAEFNELLRQLAAREDLARRDLSALAQQPTASGEGTITGGNAGLFVAPDGTAYRAVYVDAQGRPVDQYIDGPEGRMLNPNARLGYYETILDQGGPGKGSNTFRLDPSMGVRDDQDWLLVAQYNPDGTLREIAPRERTRTSSWVGFRDAITPVAIMAGLAAGGGWLANALQGAGAAGAAAGAAGAAGAGLAEGTYGAAAGLGGATAGAAGGTAAAAGGAAGLGGLAGGAATVGSLLSNPAVIGGGLSLVGGAMGADAARDAARAQEASANAAIEEIRRQYDQNRQDQMPWLQAGQTSLADLMARMGDLTTPYTQADFQNDPGYQFELAEGQRALDAAARARGLYNSTAAMRELLRYSQGLASTRYQDAWNRDLMNRQNTYNMLSGISGTGQVTAGNLGSLGQNTANTVGDLLTQTGNAQAAGRIGAANAWTNAGSQALNAWQQQMLLDRIGSNLYR